MHMFKTNLFIQRVLHTVHSKKHFQLFALAISLDNILTYRVIERSKNKWMLEKHLECCLVQSGKSSTTIANKH